MTGPHSIGRHWIVGMGLLSLSAIAWVAWDVREAQQMAQVRELGPAKDLQWLGSTGGHWLVRTLTGDILTLMAERSGFVIAPGTQLRLKTSPNGRSWVCDAELQHCIRTADVRQSLVGEKQP